jgi:preprotein translocase subunit Sss1
MLKSILKHHTTITLISLGFVTAIGFIISEIIHLLK